ncbi:hypothetical protein [Methylosinus sp. KRF6]|uniref:hypothetical protein n=1 Tax=Methylosinus sp. KRF6 TaxID=2846853 RepID=UPI001C0BC1A0|nr:hypothetical protein [Methylosinus sp. KRF6]MBU3890089.1 hypothetical protein [Methylosinus sp. KRF6]
MSDRLSTALFVAAVLFIAMFFALPNDRKQNEVSSHTKAFPGEKQPVADILMNGTDAPPSSYQLRSPLKPIQKNDIGLSVEGFVSEFNALARANGAYAKIDLTECMQAVCKFSAGPAMMGLLGFNGSSMVDSVVVVFAAPTKKEVAKRARAWIEMMDIVLVLCSRDGSTDELKLARQTLHDFHKEADKSIDTWVHGLKYSIFPVSDAGIWFTVATK